MFFISTRARRVKFWWHLACAYFTRYWLRTIISLSVVLTAGLAIFNIWPAISRSNVVTIGHVGTYTIENIPTEILGLATQSLIREDSLGKPIPSLASYWTVSDDGKTYVVFLKDNLKWHDSSPINAKDISIAISNVQINALNNKTIEFRLPNPMASFPEALDKPVFKTNSFYGTGQYRIVNIDRVGSIVKKIDLHPNTSNLPRVAIKFYQTEEQAINALKIGEIKQASVSSSQAFETWPNLTVEKQTDEKETVTVFLNNQDVLLSSKDARQGLNFAINRAGLDGEITNSPISKASWAYNDSAKKYDYNIAKAKELLSKTDLKNPKITLSYITNLAKVAQKIKSDWEAVGIKVDLKEEKSIPDNFQAFLVVNKLTPDPDQYAIWHSTQKNTNISKYKNVKIDKLLEDARTTNDEKTRRDLYFDFQKFLVEDSPAIFLYHPHKYKLTYKNTQSLIDKLPKY